METYSKDYVEELQSRITGLEESAAAMETKKNDIITGLNEKIAELNFEKNLMPVREMLTQTPYSKKLLENGETNEGKEGEGGASAMVEMSQNICSTYTRTEQENVFLSSLSDMQKLCAHLQQAISAQQCLHEARIGRIEYEASKSDPLDAEKNELTEKLLQVEHELDQQRELTAKLEAELKSEKEHEKAAEKEKEKDKEREEAEKKRDEEINLALQREAEAGKKLEEESQKKIAHFEEVLEDLQNERVAEAKKSEEQVTYYKRALEEVSREKEALLAKAKATEDMVQTLSHKVAELGQKLKASERETEKASESLQSESGNVARLASKVRTLESTNMELRTSLSEHMAARKEMEATQKEYEEMSETFVDLQQKTQQKDRELQQLKEKVVELQNQLRKEPAVRATRPTQVPQQLQPCPASPAKHGRPEPTAADALSKRRKVARTSPTIALSAFKEPTEKKAVQQAIVALGGKVVKLVADTFDPACSHIVIPHYEARTVKTIAAVLTGRWVMTKEWVMESAKAGRWLDEESYGYSLPHEGIAGKRVFLTPSYRTYAGQERVKQARQLIDYGKATWVENKEEADFVIRHQNETEDTDKLFSNNWEQFIAWIFPIDWRPACSLAKQPCI